MRLATHLISRSLHPPWGLVDTKWTEICPVGSFIGRYLIENRFHHILTNLDDGDEVTPLLPQDVGGAGGNFNSSMSLDYLYFVLIVVLLVSWQIL